MGTLLLKVQKVQKVQVPVQYFTLLYFFPCTLSYFFFSRKVRKSTGFLNISANTAYTGQIKKLNQIESDQN